MHVHFALQENALHTCIDLHRYDFCFQKTLPKLYAASGVLSTRHHCQRSPSACYSRSHTLPMLHAKLSLRINGNTTDQRTRVAKPKNNQRVEQRTSHKAANYNFPVLSATAAAPPSSRVLKYPQLPELPLSPPTAPSHVQPPPLPKHKSGPVH